MTFRTIEIEFLEGLMILRHNRPEALNARNSLMYLEIMTALAQAASDDAVAAVLLTGRGSFFSAGVDLKNDPRLAAEPDPADPPAVAARRGALPSYRADDHTTWLSTRFVLAFIDFPKPLFGGVNGPAIGEGFTSLLHCDVVYAADTAYFWAPFGRIGAVPEFCSTRLMPARLGVSLASAAIYLGRRIEVGEAQVAGFVLDVLPAGGEFEDRVVDRIRSGLALAGPPELRTSALQGFRRLVRGAEREILIRQCHAEMALLAGRVAAGETRRCRDYYRDQLP